MMVNQGIIFMQQKLLILGGTTEATALSHLIAKTGVNAIISYAGRVERIRPQPIQKRIGGFGGTAGLEAYLKAENITHVVDATHPFAAQMSQNAVTACRAANVPLAALTRPAWQKQPGDRWQHVADITAAAAWLNQPARRIMLAIGRMHLNAFTPHPQHFYLLRLVDAPDTAPAFPNHETIISRGPFTQEADMALLKQHQIDLVISKNAGGAGAYAKIEAARRLDIEVLMIDRPALPPRQEFHAPDAILDWLTQA